MNSELRRQLVAITLEWESRFGIAPPITSAISEYDAGRLVGCSEQEFRASRKQRTTVSKGYDFIFQNKRYQVKANRPSGKPGSFVTRVGKPNNYDWDYLVWILYDRNYEIQEVWGWPVEKYRAEFGSTKRLSPNDMRRGERLK